MFKKIKKYFEKYNELLKLNENNIHIYSYHGRANSMPKRLREYFDSKGKVFDDNDFVDIDEYVQFEIRNIWKKGN